MSRKLSSVGLLGRFRDPQSGGGGSGRSILEEAGSMGADLLGGATAAISRATLVVRTIARMVSFGASRCKPGGARHLICALPLSRRKGGDQTRTYAN